MEEIEIIKQGENKFLYLRGKCFNNLLSNTNIKIPYSCDQMTPETSFTILKFLAGYH